MKDTFVVGTRGSALALKQTADVIARLLAAFGGLTFDRRIIRTVGDERTDVPLAAVGAEGVFVKELESALLGGSVDLAVHSLKDLPTDSPTGLETAAYLPRADARDVLVSRGNRHLKDLPDGATIGTGSMRRQAQLALLNPTWSCLNIRGNLETRLAKLDSGQFDALILAAAGLERLGHGNRITDYLPYSALLPAPGQGAIAVQVRAQDKVTKDMVGALDHQPTRQAVEAERALLKAIHGGCQVPLGVHATVEGEYLIMVAVIASLDGTKVVRGRMEGPVAKPEALGQALGEDMLGRGGSEILAAIRGQVAQQPAR